MKKIKYAVAALLATSTVVYAAGKLQDSDFASSAEITGAGGSNSQLLNTSKIWDNVNGQLLNTTLSGFGAGNVTGQAVSVDSEVALFSGTTGKVIKRATGSGLAKLTSGVLSIAASGTDYAPATSGTGYLKGNGSGGFTSQSVPIPVADGGTGQTSYTDGQLLIGNTATGGLSKATLTAGSNVTITNGNGTITIAASGGGGGSADRCSYSGAGGTGSTNTTVMYYGSGSCTGTSLSGSNSSTNGLEITVNTAGLYCMGVTISLGTSPIDFAFTINSTQLTTNPGSGSFTPSYIVPGTAGRYSNANLHLSSSGCKYLAVNDVIRMQIANFSNSFGSDGSFNLLDVYRVY